MILPISVSFFLLSLWGNLLFCEVLARQLHLHLSSVAYSSITDVHLVLVTHCMTKAESYKLESAFLTMCLILCVPQILLHPF